MFFVVDVVVVLMLLFFNLLQFLVLYCPLANMLYPVTTATAIKALESKVL